MQMTNEEYEEHIKIRKALLAWLDSSITRKQAGGVFIDLLGAVIAKDRSRKDFEGMLEASVEYLKGIARKYYNDGRAGGQS
jgi:hypothetical protein